ncbi:MAG: hypothetical protein HRU26_04890 [Psychroserpens sp.]|nr:hypothetical protein [Psychroserpens sp.]
MGIELVFFIVAILFGIFLYWRESNGNGAYRFLNKIINSKELQMKPEDKKGFIYLQPFIPRLLFVVTFFIIVALVIQFFTPIEIFSSYNAISALASVIFGTLIGTYLANFIIKSGKVIEEKSETLEEKFESVVEKGKDLIDDLKHKDTKEVEETQPEPTSEPDPNKKSARERLKDKGLM